MNNTRTTKILYALFMLCNSGCIVLWGLMQYWFAFSVAALFIVYYIVYRWMVLRCKKELTDHSHIVARVTNYFMLWSIGKMVSTIIILFVCIKVFDYRSYVFLLSLAIVHIVFMLYEIFILREVNKTISNQ